MRSKLGQILQRQDDEALARAAKRVRRRGKFKANGRIRFRPLYSSACAKDRHRKAST